MTTSKTIVNTKRESELQDMIMRLFNRYGHNTISEDLTKENDSILQEHQYLILSPLDGLTKGLRHYIKKFNQHILKDTYLLSKYSEQELVDKIEREFLKSYNASSYLDIYRLVFQEFSNKRNIEIAGSIFQYNIINFDKPVENEVFVIKEKRIKKENGGYEKPDFAIYMNGVPVFAIEVKTRKAGLIEAFKDYKTKKTYHKFIGCIGTDMDHTFIAMDPTAPSYFLWKAYGGNGNKHRLGESNFEDLISEILPMKNGSNGLLFYIQNCSFILENEAGDKIINHRCQQYYTIKKLDVILKNIETAKDDGKRDVLIKEVVKHAQRSGKSITILSLVNLLATKYPTLFSKIYIFVPDLTILSVLKKAFGKQAIPGTGKPLQVINRIKQYEKTIERKESGLTVYLLNIQKSRIDNKTYKDNDALIIIDEVHTHQNGLGAESRDINFPNASYLSFTATPRFKNQNHHLVDVTATTYGKVPVGVNEIEYLDEFNMSDALELGIVAKLRYEKVKIQEHWDKEKSAEADFYLRESARRAIESDHELKDKVFEVEERLIKEAQEALSKGEISQQEHQELVSQAYETAISSIELKAIKKVNSITAFNIMRNMIEDKIEFVTTDVKKKRENLELDLKGRNEKPFKTKALWFVHDVQTAKMIIQQVKQLSNSEENIYKGVRYGLDYSDNGLYEEKDASENTQKELDYLNGKYFYGNHVLNDFESQDENAIDVLIVVGKYLMGYDLGTLMTVYLDTEVKEPAKFFQMATRPITSYPNKKLGYLVDITMGESNYETFLTSLEYYDNNSKMKTFVLKKEDIETEQEIIEQNLAFISRYIFEVESQDKLFENDPRYYLELLKNKDPSDQMSFFKRLKNVYTSFNKLVTPENYRAYLQVFSFYLAIGKIYYKDMFNKEEHEKLIFDPVFIQNVINDAFDSLGIQTFDQLAQYMIVDIKERIFRDEKGQSNGAETSSDSLSFIDNESDEDRGVVSLYDWLHHNSDKLDESIERQIRNKKKEEAGGEIERIIENEFNGNEMLYWVYQDFTEKMRETGNYPDLTESGHVVFVSMIKDVLGGIVDKVWEDIIERLQTVNETDIDVAINNAYQRVENSHDKISKYASQMTDSNDASQLMDTYIKFFINSESLINSDLKESIIKSITVQREEL